VTQLDDALVGVARLGLDTAPIIYFVEAHPNYDARVTAVFQRIATGALTAYTSVTLRGDSSPAASNFR
jgi:hypothetical protein